MPGLVAGRRELMAATQANLEPIFLIYDGEQPAKLFSRPPGTWPGHRGEGHRGRGPGHGRARAAGVDHDGGRRDPPAVAARRLRRAGRDLRRPGRAPGPHRRRPPPVCRLPGPAGRDARGGLGAGPWDYGLAFLVDSAAYPPRLGAIHRVLPGLQPDRAAELAKAAFTVETCPPGSAWTTRCSAWPRPGAEGTAFLLAGGPGVPPAHPPGPGSARRLDAGRSLRALAGSLDASVMQQLLLGRLWGVTDSERDVLIDHDAADAVLAVSAVTPRPPGVPR